MVVSLIFVLILVVLLATFIGHNLGAEALVQHFWFFKQYDNVPVILLVFIAFGAGVALSLLCVLFARLRKADEERNAKNVTDKAKKAEEKAQKLAEKNAKLAEKEEKKLKKNKKAKEDELNKTQEMSVSDLQSIQK